MLNTAINSHCLRKIQHCSVLFFIICTSATDVRRLIGGGAYYLTFSLTGAALIRGRRLIELLASDYRNSPKTVWVFYEMAPKVSVNVVHEFLTQNKNNFTVMVTEKKKMKNSQIDGEMEEYIEKKTAAKPSVGLSKNPEIGSVMIQQLKI